jgi:ABC-type antimicrobial peptide transport system permease subunit
MNGLFLYQVGAELASALGLLGLILAVVGVYGVISYNVSHRTQEIGIRMALGAQRAEILRMICRYSLLIVAASVPLGLLAAAAMGSLLRDFLLGVKPTDPVTYALVTVLLVSISLFAGYLPARRATRVNPIMALRHE